jgi:hypothetical protein
MPAARIVVRPVQHTAFVVPLVFPDELDFIAQLKGCDARRQVNVV